MSVIEREQEQVQVGVDPAREERARVLEAAALEIEVRGWCRERMIDSDGRVCAIGGIAAAYGIDLVAAKGSGFTAKPLLERICPEYVEFVAFNDCDARDAQDVTFVLRWRAAEIRDGR